MVNRFGHWTRTFSCRTEVWPVIEHWASENGFRLCGMRGGRRLYYRPRGLGTAFTTYLDIKERDYEVTLSSWIGVSFLSRILRLFVIPYQMNLNPRGILGVRVRRRTCRELNALLSRLGQPIIFRSDGFHIADLDASTLVFAGGCFSFLGYFFLSNVNRMEIKSGLSNPLMLIMGKEFGVVAFCAFLLLFCQHWVSLRQAPWKKWTASAVSLIAFTAFSVFHLTKTKTETIQTKLTYHCIYRYQKPACEGVLSQLSEQDRMLMLQRIQGLSHLLTIR